MLINDRVMEKLVREPVGFIVMSQLKTTKDIYAWYPLAYGRDDEENKYVLLRDRAATLSVQRKR